MNNIHDLNKIYSKLPKDKTLLKAELEKVELAIADDIKGLINQIKGKVQEMKNGEKEAAEFKKRIDKIFAEADKAEKRLEKLAESGDKLYDRGLKLQEKAAKAAKDLGVNPSNIGGFGDLEKAINAVDVASVDLVGKARTMY